jgi:hypothetical protein
MQILSVRGIGVGWRGIAKGIYWETTSVKQTKTPPFRAGLEGVTICNALWFSSFKPE